MRNSVTHTPSLHHHYSSFITTTSVSAPAIRYVPIAGSHVPQTGLSWALAAFTPDAMGALALIGVVLFGFQVWINNVQTLPSDFFPASAVGSVAGLGGTGAGIGSMIFIFTTGWVVDHFSYTPILVTAGILAPVGTLVLCLLAGRIEKVKLQNIEETA